MDYYNFMQQDGGDWTRFGDRQDSFEFRRIWLEASGTGYGVYKYKFQLDFAPDEFQNTWGDVEIRDMWIGIDHIPLLGHVRMGNFYEPMGLEANTPSNYFTFMERSFVNAFFARIRRVGICAYNGDKLGRVNWAFGAFFQDVNRKAKERVDDNQGIDVVGRVWASPLHDCEGHHVVHAGASVMYTRNRNDTLPNFVARPEYHEGVATVAAAPPVLGRDTFRLGLESAAVWGPASFQAEWFYLGSSHPVVPSTSYYGAYAYGSLFLTGENRVYKRHEGVFGRVVPLENFWIVDTCEGPCIGIGAWEVAARWSWADMIDTRRFTTNGVTSEHGIVQAFTLGVNWYWNPHARMMFNWIHGWGAYALPAVAGQPVPLSLSADYDILAASIRFDF
jgi:phosphate-selective porin OprO/OprP